MLPLEQLTASRKVAAAALIDQSTFVCIPFRFAVSCSEGGEVLGFPGSIDSAYDTAFPE